MSLHSWLKIARLQFYPMAWVAYTLGAVAARAEFNSFDARVYWIGYAGLFLIELCAVLANEYYDIGTDRINKNAGLFTGGTRMLVEGKIRVKNIKWVICTAILAIFGTGALIVRVSGFSPALVYSLFAAGLFMGLGYTTPPVKFCYRGTGELIVGITHSLYVILCGFAFQAATLRSALPWLLSGPLFLAILAAIILSGIPDWHADKAVSKKTLAVIFGPGPAVMISVLAVIAASVSGVLLCYFKIIEGALAPAMLITIPHGLVLTIVLLKLIKSRNYDRRIDAAMLLSLSYIIWFGAIPLLALVIG